MRRCLYNQCNHSIHITDVVIVISLPASLQKISMTTDCLCKIALQWKLSHKFEKLCKLPSHVKAKWRKTRVTCSEKCHHYETYPESLVPIAFGKVWIICPLFLPYTKKTSSSNQTLQIRKDLLYMYYTPLTMSHSSIIKVSLLGSH
jgi:hypothetical protein